MLEDIVTKVHPNRISFLGGLLTAAGIPLLTSPETDVYGATFIAAGQGVDCIDGYLARKFNLRTNEGARLDPLLDKVKNVFIGSYIMAKELYNDNLLLPITIVSNYAIDYISQRARGPIYPQVEEATRAIVFPSTCHRDFEELSSTRANGYGKIKAALQNVASFGYILEGLYKNHLGQMNPENEKYLNTAFASLFASAVIFGGIGIMKRLKLKRNLV